MKSLTDIYNSLTIHAIVFIGNNKSNEFKIDKICKNAEFFGRIAYLIGVKDEVFTMDAIEHGILRGFIRFLKIHFRILKDLIVLNSR
jgi:hypothetical protein